MNRRILSSLLAFFCLCILSSDETIANGKSPSSKPTPLTKIIFKDAVSDETRKYLGITRLKQFSLNDIQGSLLVIELFSTYCMTCPQNVPALNEVYKTMEMDAGMKGRVKIFGIAIGNVGQEVVNYRKAHNLLFPVLTDYDFSVHDALGNPRVPYTMYVRKTARGNVVVHSHQGILGSAEHVLKVVNSFK